MWEYIADYLANQHLTIPAFVARYPVEERTAVLDAIEELLIAGAENELAEREATPEMCAVVERARGIALDEGCSPRARPEAKRRGS